MEGSVAELRRAGWRVGVSHARRLKATRLGGAWVVTGLEERGGTTTVTVTAPDDEHTYTGVAHCRSDEHYNKKLGVKVALGRALKQYGGAQ